MYEYDCEIERCPNKTDGFLCEEHQELATRKDSRVKVCGNCNKLLAIDAMDMSRGKFTKYMIEKDCMRCRQIEKEIW